jgi:hypothetical protein
VLCVLSSLCASVLVGVLAPECACVRGAMTHEPRGVDKWGMEAWAWRCGAAELLHRAAQLKGGCAAMCACHQKRSPCRYIHLGHRATPRIHHGAATASFGAALSRQQWLSLGQESEVMAG